MKATLEYNLEDELDEFETAMRSRKTECFIEDFQNWMRSEIKYHDENKWSDENGKALAPIDVLEKVRERYFEIKSENV